MQINPSSSENKLTPILLKVLMVLIVSAFILSMFFRTADGDEAILAEQSYWLQKIYYVKSVVYTGLGFSWEVVQMHYHKLFIVVGAGIIKVFGVAEFPLRLFVLAASLTLIAYLLKYAKNEFQYSKQQVLLMLVLLFFQYHYFYFSFIFRPEIPVVLFGFLSYYFLNENLKKNENSHLYLSAIFAGLSTLMHLNGMIYIFAGFILLLINKNYKNAIYFLITAGVVSLLYFYNIHSQKDFELFLFQFTNDPNLHKADFSFWLKFVKLISEHERYFHSPKEIVLSLLFFFALIINFKHIIAKNRNLAFYTFLVMIFLAMIAHDKTDKYSLLYVPFMILIICESFFAKENRKKSISIIFTLLLVLYFSVNAVIIGMKMYKYDNLAERNKKYASLMPQKGVNVLTREGFIFNEIYNYNIVSTMSFEYRWKRLSEAKATKNDFYGFAKDNNIVYILLENKSMNKAILELIEFEKLRTGVSDFGYQVINKNADFILMKRMD